MRIAIYAFDDITMFHLAAPLMVFGELDRLQLAPNWETLLWSDHAGSIRTAEGYSISDIRAPDTVNWADIVIIPSWPLSLAPISDALKTVVRQAHTRGAIVVGLCLGAFALIDAGLLDGRPAVTHWEAMPQLAERHPGTEVDSSVLYIDHGDVLTSAGTASAIDACLHLVRKHLGAAIATRVARSLVVAPHREGGQAQYIERPLTRPATDTAIAEVMEWALIRLHESLPVERLADQARMSRRSFVRHFQHATGTTPARWILERRLHEARALLETTDWSVDTIASTCGFGSSVTFRQNFTAAFATSPSAYRRQFTPNPVPDSSGGGVHSPVTWSRSKNEPMNAAISAEPTSTAVGPTLQRSSAVRS
ncbi:probable transcriptional regulator, AraC family (plasmid) [Rhodococcus jostii RHA1]|jgi:transcriptional regulator GlxA family with amidase domain|uniref:Probable transcriptional regulator, AraC family n=1 Tax=Rhodococcus jostii (strain RHA1) TaxID=101510 RepID=Q0RVR8_RHOJR|nr:helix-turn-helix domain-containing protein [Rhodococcus jostii]ABH00618.1 probable transcriptional regulator, AraC family [Rhodococcus jostii RHA1]